MQGDGEDTTGRGKRGRQQLCRESVRDTEEGRMRIGETWSMQTKRALSAPNTGETKFRQAGYQPFFTETGGARRHRGWMPCIPKCESERLEIHTSDKETITEPLHLVQGFLQTQRVILIGAGKEITKMAMSGLLRDCLYTV